MEDFLRLLVDKFKKNAAIRGVATIFVVFFVIGLLSGEGVISKAIKTARVGLVSVAKIVIEVKNDASEIVKEAATTP